MNIITMINLFTVALTGFLCFLTFKKILPEQKSKIIFVCVIGVALILITGFRNNMGTDYLTYQYEYEQFSFNKIFDSYEVGFKILEFTSKFVLNFNIIGFMLLLATLTVISYIYRLYKDSSNIYFSVLLLLTVGSYYTSFNTTRQFLAASMFFLITPYIQKKDFKKYCMSIFLISTIHTSVLVMLPFYFITSIKFKKIIRTKTAVYLISILGIIMFLCFDSIVEVFLKFTPYSEYLESNLFNDVKLSFAVLTRPILFSTFYFLLFKYIDLSNYKQKFYFVSLILFDLIILFSFKIYIFYRFSYYVLPICLLGIANIIGDIDDKNIKKKFFVFFTITVLAYSILSNWNSIFYFVWQNF